MRGKKDKSPVRANAGVQDTKSDYQLEMQGSIDSIVAGTFKEIQSLQASRDQLNVPDSIQLAYPTNCSVPNMETLPVEGHSGDPFIRKSEVAL
jgi:hypothetical protein